MKILINNYIIFISFVLLTLSSLITSNTFSQTSSSLFDEELKTELKELDEINSLAKKDIIDLMKEMEKDNSLAEDLLGSPDLNENSNEIFFNKDNISRVININNDQDNDIRLMNELSNSNDFSSNDNDTSLINEPSNSNEFSSNDNDTRLINEPSNSNEFSSNENVLTDDISNNKSINEDNSFLSPSDNKSLNFPLINKSELGKVKISSIGFGNSELLPKNLDLWSGTTFEKAIYLINNINFNINSNVLKKIIKEILTVSHEPPSGSSNLENIFINKKLMLLANLNDLDALYKFIDLLPEDQDFDFWRSLRVKHYFLEGLESDRLACEIVDDVALNNNDNFWKKAQIFCQIIEDKEDNALFEAELLKASGSQDENFFNLLDSIIQNENFLIDKSNLNLLDITMMDQIEYLIPNEFIFKTPKYNYLALLNIENIQPETIAIIVDELLKNNSITINETELYYNIIGDSFLEFDEALNNLKLNSGPQTRADIWNSLKNIKDNENINTNILAVIKNELANGRSIQSLSLFLNLFNFSDNVTDADNLKAKEIKVIYDVFNGREFQATKSIDTQFLEKLFSLSPNQELPLDKMIEYNIQDSIPIFKLFNISVSQADYLDLYLNGNTNTLSIENNIFLDRQLKKATLDGRLVESVLVQTLMLKDNNLYQIAPKTIYDIVLSLVNLEMNEAAKELFREWLFSNLIYKTLNPLTNK